MKDIPQVKELRFKVNTAVVSHLSLGLYRNFARAIKELISNSYDAGATEIKIKLDLDKAEIIVRDNGRGMSLEDIEKKFLTIGFVTAPSDKTDELGRKRIGTFGIGCLSVFPYCDTVHVITKKRDSNELIELEIDTHRFFTGVPADIEKERAKCTIHKSDLPKKDGETIISLKGIKQHLIKELCQKGGSGWSSIDKFSGFNKFKWTLSQYSPIQFSPEHKELHDLFSNSKITPMRLWLDGKELFRNVPEGMEILEKGEEKFGNVHIKYVIGTSKKPVEPQEGRGLQVRLREVAVGFPTDFEVTKFTGHVPARLNYLSGEIYILGGLDSSLMIDRDSFSYTQEVADMQDFFRKRLNKWSNVQDDWAVKDKNIYEALMPLKNSEPIINELKKVNIIHFPKERLRLSKYPIVRKGKGKLSSPVETIKKALSEKTDFNIVIRKQQGEKKQPPVEVKAKEKSIVIYEDHPEFTESIEIEGEKISISYDKWDFKKSHYSICKLDSSGKKATFNSSHPLFKSKISEEVIKKIALGFLLIVKGRKDEEKLLSELNHLLEIVFKG
ncbi:MAG TPA: ATP-binding protein [Candidatus Wujingus californicus]|uniref:ATP-binding protein n=1 Tax=Candidatus Wujingus californicus TaxID=3367618 RepID=UPI001D220912|nr:ATP-binding protein [Planctomycetota bacterium]MDO8131977.1 ATP-binding protein [Candidatus Brocadiales bacterium]